MWFLACCKNIKTLWSIFSLKSSLGSHAELWNLLSVLFKNMSLKRGSRDIYLRKTFDCAHMGKVLHISAVETKSMHTCLGLCWQRVSFLVYNSREKAWAWVMWCYSLDAQNRCTVPLVWRESWLNCKALSQNLDWLQIRKCFQMGAPGQGEETI